MRQWRVGSFSMGAALVLFGVVLLVFQLNRQVALEMVLDWWPAVPMLLGVEILAAGFLVGDKPRLRYDWFAVLATVVVLLVSAGWQAVNASGIYATLARTVGATEYTVPLPEERIPVEPGLSRVVVENAGGDAELRSVEGSELVLFGQARLSALAEAEARELAQMARASYRRVGDTLYLTLADVPSPREFRSDWRERRWTVLVPSSLAVEFVSGPRAGSLSLVLRKPAADWIVRASGPVKLRLGAGADVRVLASVPYREALAGNLPWKVRGGDERGEQAVGPAGPVTAEATLGEGRFILRVESQRGVEGNLEE